MDDSRTDLSRDSKFIVGADGGHSLVRRIAKIPAQGDRTHYRWVRIDGVFKTNMPDADVGFASIESKSHGNVLWVQLDHGIKRVGFAMTEEMLAKYGDKLTEERAVAEAVKSMEPFSLEVEKVEWWTLYRYILLCIKKTNNAIAELTTTQHQSTSRRFILFQ